MIARASFLEAVSTEHFARLSQHQTLHNENLWKLHYLREVCKKLQLEQFYDSYMGRLRITYLILFVIIDLLAVGLHLLVLLTPMSNLGSKSGYIFVHIISSALMWSTLAVNFYADIVESHPWIRLITSCVVTLIMAIKDTGIKIYSDVSTPNLFIPANGPYILCAVYIFLPLSNNMQAFSLGMAVTVWYLIIYALMATQKLSFGAKAIGMDKVITETIFLLCVNSFGIYFRLMKEINIRLALLDRRKYVDENVFLRHAREEERRLLWSIMPEHIVDKIKNHIKSRLKLLTDRKNSIITNESSSVNQIKSHRRQPELEQLFVEPHEDVTILYADIVNFTYISANLDVKTLVETLHELFVKFDEASKDHNVLRIKFLGDCFYAVAGVSPPNEYHAKCCVDLGIKMIKIVKDVRTSRKLDISIRVGIHSGNILSGVIGACKLQYDIWSKDVDIAHHLEHTGLPNRLHISEETLNQLMEEYMYEDGTPEAKEDPLLTEFNIRTFLIIAPTMFYSPISTSSSSTETIPLGFMQESARSSNAFQLQADIELFSELSKTPLGTIRLTTGDELNRSESEEQTLQSNLSSILFNFNWNLELMFLREADDMLKYSVTMAAIVLSILLAMQWISQMQSPNPVYSYIALLVMITLMFLSWFQRLWILFFDDTIDSMPENICILFLFNIYEQVQSSIIARVVIYATIISMFWLAIFTQLAICKDWSTNTTDRLSIYKSLHDLDGSQKCEMTFDTWSITESLELTIYMMILYPRIPFLIKTILGLLIAVIYSIFIFGTYYTIYKKSPTANNGLPAEYSHIFVIVVTLLIFYIVERQTEILSREDFMLRHQLQKKQEDAEITNASITMLINNILPSHVADIYVSQQIKNELYYEEYDNVAVIFANIYNYNIEAVGLRVLNEIICDFDEVLKRFESEGIFKVEKIKLDGVVYIAACGLNFGHNYSRNTRNYRFLEGTRRYSSSSEASIDRGSNTSRETVKKITRMSAKFNEQGYASYVMAHFALQLMKTMQILIMDENVQYSNYNFDLGMLRIGISNGPIMAGVIGSFKPHYDIWGNTVNLASRMESTGVPGYIQVTKNTAQILREFNIQCNFRGMTFVKGHGEIPTYFIGIDEEFNFIPHQIRKTVVKIKE